MRARLFLALASIAVLTTCAHTDANQRNVSNPCSVGHGNGDKTAPIVCIDAVTLAANPDPVTVKGGAWVHFFINNDTGDLDIVVPSGTPLHHKGHSSAHYWAQAQNGKSAQVKYTIKERSSGRENDPTIIIEP